MQALEKGLAGLMAQSAPGRDPRFELAVMARIERRRFYRALGNDAMIGALAALVLFVLAPWLGPAMEGIDRNLVAALLAVGLGVLAMHWSLQAMEG